MMKAFKEIITYVKKYPVLLIILLVGWLVNLSFFFPINGNLGHDVYWHLALIEVAFKKFPFQIPIFSGTALKGYNYLIDLFMYVLTRFGVSSLNAYTVVLPLMYVASLSFLVVLFAVRKNKSIYYVSSLVFFVFLATPFSYLLSWYRRGSIFFGFNYPTAMQSSTALGNIAYAFTVPLIFIAFLIFQKHRQTIKDKIILSSLIGIGFGLKFYGGVILLCLIVTYEFFLFLKERDWKKSSVLLISSAVSVGLSVLLFYDPFSSVKTGGIFGFSPLAFPHNLIEDPDALYIPKLVMARYALYAAHKFSLKLIAIETVTVGIYLIYNFGTRIIGIGYLITQTLRKKISAFDLTLLITLCISIVLALTLVQKGGDWWNTVQFFGYGLLLFTFFSAESMFRLFTWKKHAGVAIIVLVIVLTMPLNVELVMKAFDRVSHPYDVSSDEKKALTFLRRQKDGAVFALPVFSQSSYVPARSGKPVFFADENILSNLGVPYQERKNLLENLKALNIDHLPVTYFYLLKADENYGIVLDKLRNTHGVKQIYDNSAVLIFEK